MKTIIKLFAILIVALFVSLSVDAENFKAPNKQSVEYTDSTTNHTYEIKDIKYKVYKSKKGAYYIWKTSSKTNKPYKMYLPKEVQIKMGRKYKE